MAVKSTAKFNETARALQNALEVFERNFLNDLQGVLNQHTSYDFSDANSPNSYVNTDSDGNIQTLLFTPADYLNGINLIIQLNNFYNNAAVTQADYGDVVSVITGR